MKKLLCLTFALAVLLAAFPIHTLAAEPLEIYSDAVALIDADTGQLLYGVDPYQKMYPASMTKIMTGLLVTEMCSPYELVTVSEHSLDAIEEPDSTGIDLKPGEQLTVEQALYALMLPSANDAANVLAEHAAGSLDVFAGMMTQRAQDIGAVNTRFSNAHGLHEDDHYTTAYDMALITAHAMQNESFRDYIGAVDYEMAPTNLSPMRGLTNAQYMLNPAYRYYHPDVLGGKTGFTHEALFTLSTYASRDGRNLVAVVMHAKNRSDTFDDTRTLIEFGFSNFTPVGIDRGRFSNFQIAIQEDDMAVGSVTYSADRDFTALLYNGVNPEQIELRFDRESTFTRDSDFACSVGFAIPSVMPGVPQLLGAIELEADVFLPGRRIVAEEGFSWQALFELLRGALFFVLVGVAGLALLLLLLAVILRQRNLRRRRRQRQQRLRERAVSPPRTVQYGQPGVRPHTTGGTPRSRSASARPRAGSGSARR